MGATSVQEELRAWLALGRVGPWRAGSLAELLRRHGGAGEFLGAGRAAFAALGLTPAAVASLEAPDWAGVEADLRWASDARRRILTLVDPDYPWQLAQIPDPPPVLYVAGQAAVLSRPQLAVVGSRRPSPTGREIARDFAAALAASGLVVTSGLAEGIDGAAHEGALDTGTTVAVAGSGPDVLYPRAHAGLAERIVERGALVSEFPTGTPPRAANFPQRNRVVSGLSRGVLVVEAALRSGSLISARLAAEQGREVFAVPGSIRNPVARGCHALIRQGAKLVESVEDILEELGGWPAAAAVAVGAAVPSPQAMPSLDEDYLALLEVMDEEPATLDQLLHRSGLTANVLSSMLLRLELEGVVSTPAAGRYARRRVGG